MVWKPNTPWTANSTSPKADQSYQNGDRPAGGGTGAAPLIFTPTILLDAESAPIGGTYEGTQSDQWSDAAGETYGQNTQVFEGSRGWELNIAQGADGFGTWGGRKDFPSLLGKGDSVQYQVTVFFPVGFDWTVSGAGNRLKFTRVNTQTNLGVNQGYHDLYIDNATFWGAENDGRLREVFEGLGSGQTIDGQNLVKGTWETIEVRIDFDDISSDSGGDGRVRVWRNIGGAMTLILDRTNRATLVNSTDQSASFLLFTFWNANSPATQSMYADRIVVETDLTKLVETDAGGTPIIGGVQAV